VSTVQEYGSESLELTSMESVPKGRGAWSFLEEHPRVTLAGGALLLLALVALLAPLISPQDPIATNPDVALQAPGAGHLLGTDELGRDLLSRVIWGARVSLPVAFVAVGVGLVVGAGTGLLAGYRGEITDLVLMRFVDALLAFPALILAIAIAAALGPGLRNAMIAIGVVQIPIYARLTRAQVLQLRELDFIAAARMSGARPVRIVFRHMIPNLLNPLIVQVSLSTAFAILAEATLSFLGLGAQPPAADWGFMINTGARFLANDPWLALGPGMAICVSVFAFNWLGDALRDALDPRLRT
jgi:peptide/nickel transport system permease protein